LFSVSIFRRPKTKNAFHSLVKKKQLKAKFFSLKWSKRPAEKKKSDDADQTKDGEERERRSRAHRPRSGVLLIFAKMPKVRF